jgi:hypothetical protein
MPPAQDPGSFLARWSRRKAEDRRGAARPPAPPATAVPAAAAAVPARPAAAAPSAGPSPALTADRPGDGATLAHAAETPAAPPAPTLEDVAALRPDAEDFSRFVARDVSPEVRNAALKKLFADPHFNVMDGLDTYIEDYGRPDPLPARLRALMTEGSQGRFLGLFDDERPKDAAATSPPCAGPAGERALQTPDNASPAGSAPPADARPDLPTAAPDEDADLRLQPHDAAGPAGPPAGAGPAAGCHD